MAAEYSSGSSTEYLSSASYEKPAWVVMPVLELLLLLLPLLLPALLPRVAHALTLHSTLLSNQKEMLYLRRAGVPALLFFGESPCDTFSYLCWRLSSDAQTSRQAQLLRKNSLCQF